MLGAPSAGSGGPERAAALARRGLAVALHLSLGTPVKKGDPLIARSPDSIDDVRFHRLSERFFVQVVNQVVNSGYVGSYIFADPEHENLRKNPAGPK
jgi:hypothetical protein